MDRRDKVAAQAGFAATLFAMMACPAAVPPPPAPEIRGVHSDVSGGSLSDEPRGFSLGSSHVEFEQTTLADILTLVRSGEISHQGDAGESVYWLCYTIAHGRRSERLWILADGEMGGPAHDITGISAQFLVTEEPTKECPLLPLRFTPVTLDLSIGLASSAKSVLAHLGGALPAGDQWGHWIFDAKTSRSQCPDGGKADRTGTVSLRFKRGHVDMLRVDQTTTC